MDSDRHKKKKLSKECAQSLPAISGAIAAALTEGKTVKEMEMMALFFSALSNDIFLIAATRNKFSDLFFDDGIL